MNEGKIYITISDERTGGKGADGSSVEAPKKEQKSDSELLKDYAKYKFSSFIESQAKTFVNYSISNIGNFQGDYQQQRSIQATISSASELLGIGMATIAGAKYGAVGALVGFTIATASTAINSYLQYNSGKVAVNQENYSIEQLKKISGLSTLTNGSR